MTEMTGPEAGGKAPAFTLPRAGGGDVSLAEYAGRNVDLHFYPRDDTPGCTTEAIEFTAEAPAFKAANTVVIGISKDGVAKHEKFIAKHELGVILASDENGSTCEDYGVWAEKKNYGKTYMGIERSTFLIGGDGMVRAAWRKVKVKGHVAAALAAAKAL